MALELGRQCLVCSRMLSVSHTLFSKIEQLPREAYEALAVTFWFAFGLRSSCSVFLRLIKKFALRCTQASDGQPLGSAAWGRIYIAN